MGCGTSKQGSGSGRGRGRGSGSGQWWPCSLGYGWQCFHGQPPPVPSRWRATNAAPLPRLQRGRTKPCRAAYWTSCRAERSASSRGRRALSEERTSRRRRDTDGAPYSSIVPTCQVFLDRTRDSKPVFPKFSHELLLLNCVLIESILCTVYMYCLLLTVYCLGFYLLSWLAKAVDHAYLTLTNGPIRRHLGGSPAEFQRHHL